MIIPCRVVTLIESKSSSLNMLLNIKIVIYSSYDPRSVIRVNLNKLNLSSN